MLAVVYRGKPTQHILRKDTDGAYCVNNKRYGNARSIEEVCVFSLMYPMHTNQCHPNTVG